MYNFPALRKHIDDKLACNEDKHKMSSNFSQIGPVTVVFAALEHL